MPEALKERSEIPEQYKWNLTRMFADDAAWRRLWPNLTPRFPPWAAHAGTLNTAAGPARLV